MFDWPYYTLIAGRLHRDERVKVRGVFGVPSLCGYQTLPKKDGTHSYDKIAPLLIYQATSALARKKIEAARHSNTAAVAALQEELAVNDYYGPTVITTSASETKPAHVKVPYRAGHDRGRGPKGPRNAENCGPDLKLKLLPVRFEAGNVVDFGKGRTKWP